MNELEAGRMLSKKDTKASIGAVDATQLVG